MFKAQCYTTKAQTGYTIPVVNSHIRCGHWACDGTGGGFRDEHGRRHCSENHPNTGCCWPPDWEACKGKISQRSNKERNMEIFNPQTPKIRQIAI